MKIAQHLEENKITLSERCACFSSRLVTSFSLYPRYDLTHSHMEAERKGIKTLAGATNANVSNNTNSSN